MNENHEFLAIKSLLLEQKEMLQMLLPVKASISFIAETTGKSRQTILSYVKDNFEPKTDYWKENGKIYLSQSTTIVLLRKYNAR